METLTAPIVLGTGASLAGRDFVIAPDFAAGPRNAVIDVAPGAAYVTIRDVRILGPRDYPTAWAHPKLNGIRAEGIFGLKLERVHVEGVPRAGIVGYGWTSALVKDCSARHCFVGLNLGHTEPSRNVMVERFTAGHMWASEAEAVTASRVRPGGWVGGDGFALNSLRDSSIIDCVVYGEQFGACKITNPQRVYVRRLRATSLMVQGIPAPPVGDPGNPARDVLIEDCVFDQGLCPVVTSGGTLHITLYVASCRVENCVFEAAGHDWNAILVTHDAHVDLRGNTFRGFNGIGQGGQPAAALDLVSSQGCSANGDFATVNHFVEQQHILRER